MAVVMPALVPVVLLMKRSVAEKSARIGGELADRASQRACGTKPRAWQAITDVKRDVKTISNKKARKHSRGWSYQALNFLSLVKKALKSIVAPKAFRGG